MVDAVGEVLGLQTERTAQAIPGAALAGAGRQGIGRIELDTGLVRGNGQGNAGFSERATAAGLLLSTKLES